MPETPYEGPERRRIEEPGRYIGPERRATPGDRAFTKAVTEAAAEAAQRVSRVHRVRLVTQAALAAFAAAFIINTALGYLYRIEARRDALGLARTNCSLVTRLSGALSDFVETDANLRASEEHLTYRSQVISGYTKLFGKSELGALLKRSHQIDQRAIYHWRVVDEGQLAALASTNCAARLR